MNTNQNNAANSIDNETCSIAGAIITTMSRFEDIRRWTIEQIKDAVVTTHRGLENSRDMERFDAGMQLLLEHGTIAMEDGFYVVRRRVTMSDLNDAVLRRGGIKSMDKMSNDEITAAFLELITPTPMEMAAAMPRVAKADLTAGTDELHRRAATHHLDKEGVMKIDVYPTTDSAVESVYQELRGKSRATSNLDLVFQIALIGADYSFKTEDVEGMTIHNGTGEYYDPLTKAVFYVAGTAISQMGTTIRYLDEKTKRHLYIVVLAEGKNFVIHDRYSRSGADDCCLLVMTSGRLPKPVIGMEPTWVEGCVADLIMAAHFFGFEIHRGNSAVYLPHQRTENLIASTAQMLRSLDQK